MTDAQRQLDAMTSVLANSLAESSRLREINAELLAALKEVEKGKGEFSMDPLEHAGNCIDSMREIACAAIAKAEDSQ